MLILLTKNNKPALDGIKLAIKRSIDQAVKHFPRLAGEAIKVTTANHWSSRFTGKYHNPNKITVNKGTVSSNGATSEVIIKDVADIGRAYHPVVIRPKFRKKLTIPCHATSYGKKAADFDGLFRIKNGLYKNFAQGIVKLFILANKVNQPQDKTIMPDDSTYSINIFTRMENDLVHSLQTELGKI